MNVLLLVGCGDLEVGQISIAREFGLAVAVTDRNKNAKAFEFADFTAQLDATDIYGISEFALKINENNKIAAIYSGTEAYLTVSLLTHLLSIDEGHLRGSAICYNKRRMKEIWLEKGINTPPYVHDWKGKCVLKPESSSSGRGVQISSAPLAPQDGMIAERHIKGSHHDVNGLMVHGNFFRAGITDRTFLPDSPVQDFSRAPSTLSPIRRLEAYKLLEEATLALGLYHGPVKGDLIFDGEKFWILEAGPRFHGDLATIHMTPMATGINAFKAHLAYSLHGDNWHSHLEEKHHKVALAKALSSHNPRSNDDIERFVVVVGEDADDAEKRLERVLAGEQDLATLDIRRNNTAL